MDNAITPAPRARVACVSGGGTQSLASLKASLEAAGYSITGSKAECADICLVDLRQTVMSIRKARKIAGLLRAKAPEASILFLADPGLPAEQRASLRRLGELVYAGARYDHLIERFRQILRLRNIADEAAERMKS
ncbi:MAG: hypothetical protein ACX939_10570, partial [Hyphococcus sp.]